MQCLVLVGIGEIDTGISINRPMFIIQSGIGDNVRCHFPFSYNYSMPETLQSRSIYCRKQPLFPV